jgi:peptide/nickel transport system substrate-binding protein
LVLQDANGRTIQPMLATDWQSVDVDRWRFRLRPDVTFHDGSKMTSADVFFTFQRYLRPMGKAGTASRLATVKDLVIVDPNTIDVITRGPDPVLLKRIAQASILPMDYFQKVGESEFAQHPVGTGAYRLKDYVPDDKIVLTANPDHYNLKPMVQTVIIRNVPLPQARLNGLRTGAIDYTDDMPIEMAANLQEQFNVQTYPSGLMLVCSFDVTSGGPFADKRVRQAVNYAIDKEALSHFVYKDFFKPLSGQIASPGAFGFNPKLKPYPFDQSKARGLLIDAGFPAFHTTMEGKITGPEVAELLQLVQDELKEVGIDTQLDAYRDPANMRDTLFGGKHSAPISYAEISLRPTMDVEMAYSWLKNSYPPGTRGYENSEFDRFYLASIIETDANRRDALLQRAAGILYDDPPVLFLLEAASVHIWNKAIDGIQPRAADDILLWSVHRTR